MWKKIKHVENPFHPESLSHILRPFPDAIKEQANKILRKLSTTT